MVYQYSWNGPNKAVSAEEVGRHMEVLQEKYGEVTKEIFLDSARSKKSKMHDLFEWNDTKAAEKYRLVQAQNIICSLKVTVIEEEYKPITVRAFVTERERSSGYLHVRDALSDEEMRESVLAAAKRDAQWYIDKYDSLRELSEVIASLNSFVNSKKVR